MGDGMARNLIKGGREVVVWNRTGSKAADFSKQTGCQTAGTPREVSARTCVYTVFGQKIVLVMQQRFFVALSFTVFAGVLFFRPIASARAGVVVSSVKLTPTRERRLPESEAGG